MPALSEAKPIESPGIQPLQRLYFKAAVTYFQIKRSLQNFRESHTILPTGNRSDFPFLLAESKSPIFSDRVQERPFEEEKRRNLQIALKNLESIVVSPGAGFSFWRQIGRPTAKRGYRVGREIRWGCTIPAVGGGLCQLSGALYECALQAGAKILEAHPHSHRLPDAPYHPERDATIFWNYVDLRFQPSVELLIEPVLTEEELVLRFWGKVQPVFASAAPRETPFHALHDCLACGLEVCSYHEKTQRISTGKGLIFNPRQGSLSPAQRLKSRFLSLTSRFLNRFFHTLGYPVGKVSILRAKGLAAAVKTLYPFQKSEAMVSQDLAPFLADWLQTRGIPYVLQLEHLPIRELQTKLDQMARLHPQDSRLNDFRATQDLAGKELVCIQKASALWTDHPYLKEFFPRVEFNPGFQVPAQAVSRSAQDVLLFPGPCYAREGFAELLEAAGRLHLQVVCPHPTAKENPQIQYVEMSQLPWGRILAYVHPCVFDRPNFLLKQAVANEIPIVGTVGVPYRGPLFCECLLGNVDDLEGKLKEIYIWKKGDENV